MDDDDDNDADDVIDHEVDNLFLENNAVVVGAAVCCYCFCC